MSILKEDASLLQKIPMFAEIKRSQLKLLAYASELVTFEPDEIIVKQGDQGDSAYVIIDGKADVNVSLGANDLTVAKMASGDIVGEIAIFCDVPRTATVYARTPVKSLKIGKDALFSLMVQIPEMGIEITRQLAQRHQSDLAGQFPRKPTGQRPLRRAGACGAAPVGMEVSLDGNVIEAPE